MHMNIVSCYIKNFRPFDNLSYKLYIKLAQLKIYIVHIYAAHLNIVNSGRPAS